MTTPERKVGAKTAEDLLLKYNLPPGSDDEAIQRVLARLGDLPVSAEKSAAPKGSQGKSSPKSKPVFRPAGGTPKTRVAWSASEWRCARHRARRRRCAAARPEPAAPQ